VIVQPGDRTKVLLQEVLVRLSPGRQARSASRQARSAQSVRGRRRYLAVGVAVAAVVAANALYAQANASAVPSDAITNPICCALSWQERSFTFRVQKPWDLNVSDRYSYNASTKTHLTWVRSTDKPHSQSSNTDPRTEMRWFNEYSSGWHMWASDVYIPSGTAGTSIMQIKHIDDESDSTTDYMLRVYSDNGGTFKRYCCTALKTGIYNKWWKIQVVHNADTGAVYLGINGVVVDTASYPWRGTRVFKNGVYATSHPTATAHFRNLKYYIGIGPVNS
jgi:hypothetical protein